MKRLLNLVCRSYRLPVRFESEKLIDLPNILIVNQETQSEALEENTPIIRDALVEQDSMMELLDTDEIDREMTDIHLQTKKSLAETMGLLNNIYGYHPKQFSTNDASEDALADAIESAEMNFELNNMKKVTRMTLVETLSIVGRMQANGNRAQSEVSGRNSPRIRRLPSVKSTNSGSPVRKGGMLVSAEALSESDNEDDIEAELAQMRAITDENVKGAMTLVSAFNARKDLT